MPRDYLTDYYSEVEPDELETIRFFVDAIETASTRASRSCSSASARRSTTSSSPRAARVGDPPRPTTCRRTCARSSAGSTATRTPTTGAPFVRYTLECEGIASPTDAQIGLREELTRARITRLLEVDARHAPPLPERYATVVSAYCADSATADRATWETYMRHIAAPRPARRPVHHLRAAPLRRLLRRRPPVPERERRRAATSRAVLAGEFDDATVEARELAEHESQGYGGIVLAAGARGQRMTVR